VSLQDDKIRRLGLPANAGCGGRAHGGALAGRCGDVAAMESWRGPLSWCSCAGEAVLEVDPLPLTFLDLRVHPPPWAPHHQPCERSCPTSDAASASSAAPATLSLLSHSKVGSHLPCCSGTSCFQASLA